MFFFNFQKKPPLPLYSIFTSLPVWAMIICQVGHNYGLFFIQNYFPKYMKSVLKFSAAKVPKFCIFNNSLLFHKILHCWYFFNVSTHLECWIPIWCSENWNKLIRSVTETSSKGMKNKYTKLRLHRPYTDRRVLFSLITT